MNELWLGLFLFFLFSLYYLLKNKFAIFFPSSKRIIQTILEFADLRKDDVLLDLGSGDGRILMEAGRRGVKAIGIEKNRILNWVARRKIRKAGLKNVKIIQGDIFEQDLSKASVIVAYLSRSLTLKLQRKVEKEAKKGTRIIVVDHFFKGWKPEKIKRISLIPVRLYIK